MLARRPLIISVAVATVLVALFIVIWLARVPAPLPHGDGDCYQDGPNTATCITP